MYSCLAAHRCQLIIDLDRSFRKDCSNLTKPTPWVATDLETHSADSPPFIAQCCPGMHDELRSYTPQLLCSHCHHSCLIFASLVQGRLDEVQRHRQRSVSAATRAASIPSFAAKAAGVPANNLLHRRVVSPSHRTNTLSNRSNTSTEDGPCSLVAKSFDMSWS